MESRKMVAMNLFAKQKQRYRHRGQTYGHQGEQRGGGRLNGEIRIDIYIRLCIRQTTDENLLYSTGKGNTK